MSEVMAGCSGKDFLLHNFSFPLQHYQPCSQKKKKILITLNAFEDEQSNYKAEVRPRVVQGL